MIKAVVFGKGHGCSKCDALKKRLHSLLSEERFSGVVFVFNDVLTEDGLVEFLKAEELNPNRIPALLMEDEHGFIPECRDDVDDYDNSSVPGLLGVQTDYDKGGGVITPQTIRRLLELAVR